SGTREVEAEPCRLLLVDVRQATAVGQHDEIRRLNIGSRRFTLPVVDPQIVGAADGCGCHRTAPDEMTSVQRARARRNRVQPQVQELLRGGQGPGLALEHWA